VRKKCLGFILAIIISLNLVFPVQAGDAPVTVRLNEQVINFIVAPVIENDRCLVPLRPSMDALGAKIDWDEQSRAATVYLPAITLTITSDSPTAIVNGQQVLLPVVPTIRDGVLMIPLRAIADICNVPVGWDSATSTITLYTNENPAGLLDILTVNDFHGALLGYDKNPGAAKLGRFLQDKKAQNPDGTLILSAGDMSQGTADSNLLFGETVIKAMNVIGFDAVAVGNHEFDWGLDNLKEQSAWAKFPILTANITNMKTGDRPEGTEPWIIVEKKGVKIGIIGVTTMEAIDKVNPNIISAFKIHEPAETINRLVPELKQQGAQVIIVLGHLGGYLDNKNTTIIGEAAEVANNITGVDALISGHTHQKMAGYINGIPVVQAYYNGRAVGHITLKYSAQAQKVVAAISSVIDLPTPGLTEDALVKAIIDNDQKKIDQIKNEYIGKTLGDLSHQRDEVSVLGQWVTDIMRQQTNADIAFQNGGGLRTSITAGDVTVGQLWEVIPFDNTFILMDMQGSQIMAVLQHGINNPNYGSIQYSGVKVEYDSSLSPDRQIVRVTLPDGSILNPEYTYRVVTNDFLAAGGDGYTMFKEGTNVIDTHRLVREALIEVFKKFKTIDFQGDDRYSEVLDYAL